MTNDISWFWTLKSVLRTLYGHNLLPLDRTTSLSSCNKFLALIQRSWSGWGTESHLYTDSSELFFLLSVYYTDSVWYPLGHPWIEVSHKSVSYLFITIYLAHLTCTHSCSFQSFSFLLFQSFKISVFTNINISGDCLLLLLPMLLQMFKISGINLIFFNLWFFEFSFLVSLI